jgi:hypothetical protein
MCFPATPKDQEWDRTPVYGDVARKLFIAARDMNEAIPKSPWNNFINGKDLYDAARMVAAEIAINAISLSGPQNTKEMLAYIKKKRQYVLVLAEIQQIDVTFKNHLFVVSSVLVELSEIGKRVNPPPPLTTNLLKIETMVRIDPLKVLNALTLMFADCTLVDGLFIPKQEYEYHAFWTLIRKKTLDPDAQIIDATMPLGISASDVALNLDTLNAKSGLCFGLVKSKLTDPKAENFQQSKEELHKAWEVFYSFHHHAIICTIIYNFVSMLIQKLQLGGYLGIETVGFPVLDYVFYEYGIIMDQAIAELEILELFWEKHVVELYGMFSAITQT